MVEKKTPSKVRGVYERDPGSGVWWVRFTEDGKIRREKVGRRSDAIALYQKRKSEIRAGIKLPNNLRERSITISELGEEAKQWYKDHGKRDLRTFKGRMDLIIRELGSRAADTVKPKEIDDWLSSHPRWSPATKNRYKTVLSKAYELALRSDKVSRNPVRSVEHRNEGDGRIRYLRPEEEISLKAAIASRCPGHMPAFVFALHTGLRKSEQFGLRWSDVDMSRKVIIVSHPKNNRSREITMNETCFEQIGHRITGDRRGQSRRRACGEGLGWEFVHVCIDDASRVAFSQILPDEKAASAVPFLKAAVAYYASLGVAVTRVMTDNGSCYKAFAFRNACRELGLRHTRTRPYTPKTNGKAERFIQTALREWAYAQAYPTSDRRAEQLPVWLHRYNWHRPHGGINSQTPISRLGLTEDNLLRLHTLQFSL